MKKINVLMLVLALFVLSPLKAGAANAVLLGWNNLGMHCMDSRYAEFAILPPYNTIEAQLIVGGKLVTASSIPGAAEYTVTYEPIADPLTKALNSTSKDKSDWVTYAPTFFPGLKNLNPSYVADMGLAGCDMPGIDSPLTGYKAKPMLFQPTGVISPLNTYHAEGVPITPYDDAGNKNTYPMMRLVARQGSATGTIVAQSDVVLPVSDEMSCKTCHAANSNPAAQPSPKWIEIPNKEREYRLNVLKLHDDKQLNNPDAKIAQLYRESLATNGINPNGLYASAMETPAKPVLCAACHQSEALGKKSFQGSDATGQAIVPSLTSSIHNTHAKVTAPNSNLALDDSNNRAACYDCHPGSKTRCLRGAMGSAVATDGTMEMQCQSCHGNMSKVGDPKRTGWLNEPTCQSCHTGTATNNNGKIRYNSVYNDPLTYDSERIAVNQTFATNANTPDTGYSLYRFSKGHGGLQCAACHGSTHAEFPSSHKNDNIRNEQLQGHAGVTAECQTCHNTAFDSKDKLNSYPGGAKGPHGLHPMNSTWAKEHHDFISTYGGISNCQSCHGNDLKGTELSRVQGDRSFDLGSEHGGIVKFYRGATIGCYSCHNGTSSSSTNTTPAPVTQDITATTNAGKSVSIALPVDASGVNFRVLQQPQNGTVGIVDGVASYFPFDNFSGTDSFTFAGYNGSKNTDTLNKGTVPATATITVLPGKPSITTQPSSQVVIAGSTVTFEVVATGSAPLSYQWSKIGSPPIGNATNSSLTLSNVSLDSAGSYQVTITNSAGSVTSNAVTLTVQQAPIITTQPQNVTIAVGSSTSLSVVASGYPAVSYQWYKAGSALSGQTGSTLTIGPATATSAGSYYVVVKNSLGTATSSSATVKVNAKLTVNNATPAYGTVTGANNTINCGSTCASDLTAGSSVTLKATATAPHKFTGWSGCSTKSGTSCTVVMSTAKTVTASFK